MPFNVPALWRFTKFYSQAYPITNVANVHVAKPIQVNLKKYLSGDTDFLSRIIVRVSGPIVIAGAAPGVATGNDNIGGLLVSANMVTSPIFANCVPINGVSGRGLHVDGIVNAGGPNGSDPQALGGSTPVADTAGTVQINFYTEINFKRCADLVRAGVEYDLPLAKYNSAILTLLFGGREQLFSATANTWDLSGLTVDFFADLDVGVQPKYIHAHEIFEGIYPVLASNKDLKIDNLASGFVYTDLAFVSENAGAPVEGILNNISIYNGAQVWFPKGEANADAFRYANTSRNSRTLQSPSNVTGLFAVPMKDRMFSRAFDARYSPLTISLDVTSLSATSQIRVVGRRMLPGGIYAKAGK